MHMVIDYEPCDRCRVQMDQGVLIIEASDAPVMANQREIQRDVYPTGRWAVVRPEAAAQMFGSDATESVLRHRKVFIDVRLWEQVGLPRKAREAG